MNAYKVEVELEPAEPNRFVVTVPGLSGLLVLGTSVDDVLERARASIAFHAGIHDNGHNERIDLVPHIRAGTTLRLSIHTTT